jgi:Kef-type K+ transport system membrane component KefB
MLTQHLLLQLVLILAVVQVCGYLAGLIGQQWVIGEIIAGIVLGPTLFGAILPGLSRAVFPESVLPTLQTLGDIGLVLYMFTVGVRLDAGDMLSQGKRAVAVSASGIVVPLVLGAALAYALFATPGYAGPHVANRATFMLLVGTAMGVTAFPVLARILVDMGLLRTPLGTLAMTCAALNDIAAWCLLALIVALARAQGVASAGLQVLETTVFIGVMLVVVRPLLAQADKRLSSPRLRVALIMALVWLAADATMMIGIHPVFGAFLMGLITPRSAPALDFVRNIDKVNSLIFLPLFFIFSGLRTSIGLVDTPQLWLVCLAILAVAIAGKLAGSALAMRATGVAWPDSLALGVLMNTRGLVQLIVLNIGLDAGLLSPRFFTMLVIMALVTTMMASPLLPLLGCRKSAESDEVTGEVRAHLAK